MFILCFNKDNLSSQTMATSGNQGGDKRVVVLAIDASKQAEHAANCKYPKQKSSDTYK